MSCCSYIFFEVQFPCYALELVVNVNGGGNFINGIMV